MFIFFIDFSRKRPSVALFIKPTLHPSMKPHLLLFACGLILATFSACEKDETPIVKDYFLKDYSSENNIQIGSLFNYSYSKESYKNSELYNTTLAQEFDTYSLEWEFAADEIWKSETEYDFTYLDKALSFAKDHNMTVRGTHLLWYAQAPSWLEDGNYTNSQVKTMTKNYIKALGTHVTTNWPGILTEVNVANEILQDKQTAGPYGFLRDCFWAEKLGTAWVDSAFVWANEAFPDATLILNEYGNEFANDIKAERFLDLAKRLKNSHIPIDAIGLQCHFTTDKTEIYDVPFDSTQFAAALQNYADLGLDIYLTELDIRINDDEKGKTTDKLQAQADLYAQIFRVALRQPAVKGITFWGFNDDLSYLNGHASWLPQSRDWGLIFDADFNPKLAYFSITEVLKR